MITLKPDMTDGTVVLLSPDGDPLGVAVARASRTIPGYVTVITDTKLGYAIRVPADWPAELGALPRICYGPPYCSCGRRAGQSHEGPISG